MCEREYDGKMVFESRVHSIDLLEPPFGVGSSSSSRRGESRGVTDRDIDHDDDSDVDVHRNFCGLIDDEAREDSRDESEIERSAHFRAEAC